LQRRAAGILLPKTTRFFGSIIDRPHRDPQPFAFKAQPMRPKKICCPALV